jgi:hypothetical protein
LIVIGCLLVVALVGIAAFRMLALTVTSIHVAIWHVQTTIAKTIH